MKLTMTRNGEVDVQWTPNNANQCGMRRTTPEVSKLWYQAIVVGDSSHLDSQGFIADQFEIHQIITSTLGAPDIFRSCEQSAAEACESLWLKLGPSAPVQRVCEVRITVGAIGPDGDHWAGICAQLGSGRWQRKNIDRTDRSANLAEV